MLILKCPGKLKNSSRMKEMEVTVTKCRNDPELGAFTLKNIDNWQNLKEI